MPDLRVIIVGAGLIGPRHAQSVQAHPSTKLLAFIDPVPSETISSLNVPCYPSLESLLQSQDKPDAAIVCTPNHTHVPVTLNLLSHGIRNILLEKPVSDSLESAESLLSALKSTSSPAQNETNILIAHHRRFNPYIRATKALLDSNSLGRIIAVNGLWTLLKPPSYFQGNSAWRADRKKGGVLGINLIHDIDVLQFLFGAVVRVFAEPTSPQRAGNLGGHTAEEGGAITLRFASGVVGTFLVCDAVPAPWNFEMGTGENPNIPPIPTVNEDAGGSDCYRIFGSKASLSVPDMTRWSYDGVTEGEKGWNREMTMQKIEVQGRETKPFDMQWEHFVSVIKGKEEVCCGVEDGASALSVVQAVREAMEGKVVDIGHSNYSREYIEES